MPRPYIIQLITISYASFFFVAGFIQANGTYTLSSSPRIQLKAIEPVSFAEKAFSPRYTEK